MRRLHVGALALVLVTGAGAAGLRVLDDAAPVSVDDAVERFRGAQSASSASPVAPAPGGGPAPARTPGPGTPAQQARGGTPKTGGATPVPGAPRASGSPGAPRPTVRPSAAAAQPPEGVYVYTTTGYETGKAGPMQGRHDYPERTTLTVTRRGCGSSLRWEPVDGRWDDIADCVTGRAVKITVYDTYHEFFGVGERHTYTCTGDSWFRPPSVRPGYRWEFRCDSGAAQTHTRARLVGIERVTVGDGTVEALHVRFDTTMTGRTEGSNPSDYWLALHEPYLLRRVARVDATVRTDFGTLDYHEQYETRLVSRRPRT